MNEGDHFLSATAIYGHLDESAVRRHHLLLKMLLSNRPHASCVQL